MKIKNSCGIPLETIFLMDVLCLEAENMRTADGNRTSTALAMLAVRVHPIGHFQ